MPVSTSLRGRVPGQGVIADIVAAQQHVAPRSRAARILGFSPLTSETRTLYRAAIGELAVAEMLDQLGPRWDILHVVPMRDLETDPADDPVAAPAGANEHFGTVAGIADCDTAAQIDHLVIGPPGVFALTTENYPGHEIRITGDTMTIGGRSVHHIPVARELAARAAERLSAASGQPVVVKAVIVVIDIGRLVIRDPPDDVMIVTSRQLIRMLTKLDHTLVGTQVAHISDVADRDTTWDSNPTPPEAGLRLSQDFAALRVQVRDAMQSRVLWAILGFVIVCAAAWIGTALIVSRVLGS